MILIAAFLMLCLTASAQIIRGPVTTSSDGRSLVVLNKAGMQAFLGFTTNGVIVGSTNLNIIAGTNISVVVANGTNIIISADVGTNDAANIAGQVVTNLATSSTRVMSILPPPNGDTNWFGPWTTGTLTAGFQEAEDSLTNSFGGTILITPGSYFTATNIHMPSTVLTNRFNLVMHGPGMTAGGITYTGSVPQTAFSFGRNDSKTPYIVWADNMWFASNTNACTNVVSIIGSSANGSLGGGVARGGIRGCYIGYWRSMTNNNCFGAPVFTPSSCTDGIKHNLIGIYINLNFNDPFAIVENSINYCQSAISFACDHGMILDNTFEHDGNEIALSDWPTSSPYYCGAAMTLLDPNGLNNANKNWRIRGNVYVNCPLHVFANLYNGGVSTNMYYRSANNILIDEDDDEGGTALGATTGATLTFLNPKFTAYAQYPLTSYWITNTANYSSWSTRIASNSPANGSNVVAIVDLRIGNSTIGMSYYDGLGVGTNAGAWSQWIARPGFRQLKINSLNDDSLVLLGSAISGSSNWFAAATSMTSGLGVNKLVFGLADSDASAGTAAPVFSLTALTKVATFVGAVTAPSFAGDGSAVTSVNASSLTGVTTNNLATGFTNADLSITIAQKLNLTNPPAISGFYLRTNSAFPATSDVGGSAYCWNSNGVVYLVTSTPFSVTWAATNKLAP